MFTLLGLLNNWKWSNKDDEAEGQAMVEYSLLIVLIVIVCIVVVTQIGDITRNGLYAAIEDLPL